VHLNLGRFECGFLFCAPKSLPVWFFTGNVKIFLKKVIFRAVFGVFHRQFGCFVYMRLILI